MRPHKSLSTSVDDTVLNLLAGMLTLFWVSSSLQTAVKQIRTARSWPSSMDSSTRLNNKKTTWRNSDMKLRKINAHINLPSTQLSQIFLRRALDGEWFEAIESIPPNAGGTQVRLAVPRDFESGIMSSNAIQFRQRWATLFH